MQENGGYFLHSVDQMLTKLTNEKSRWACFFCLSAIYSR